MEQEFDIGAYVAAVKRRIWFLLIPIVVIAAAGVVFAFALPPKYEARATILVESQQIPVDLAAPTVTADAAERIQVIQQRLLARDNLLEIAGKFDLFAYEGSRRTPTTIVENMRESIVINQIDVGSRSRNVGVIGFTVSFKYRSAPVSSRVTNELVASILSQNLETRLSRASETAQFFENQQQDIEQRILDLETRIANYKRENGEFLPETLSDRRVQLAQIRAQISAIDLSLQSATLLAAEGENAVAPLSGDAQQIGFTIKARQVELESLREELAELEPLVEKGFVPQNQVRELERRISLAEINIEALEAQAASQGGVVNGANGMTLLEARRTELAADADALSESIARTPVVEVELNAMNRDYENLQSEYRQSQARLEDALTGERLEQDRQSERFEVIEQATVPTEPSEPNRPRIIIAGAFGGVAVGVGLVILLELLNNSLYSANDLERRLQLRPIAVIPYITTDAESRRRKLKFLLLTAIAVAGFAILLAAVHIYYLPLELVFTRISRPVNELFTSVFGSA